MTFHLKSPKNIDPDTFNKIIELIVSGGEVSRQFVQVGLKNAKIIGYAMKDDQVVSTASIKVPNPAYKDKVFSQSGIEDDMGVDFEYGYNVTHPDYRRMGYTTKLNKLIFDHFSLSVFATVRNENYMSKELLIRSGFQKVGNSFKSSNGDYMLSLMIRK